ncbi:DUF3971 domain-containing protein [Rickettsiaceae bacterium]|nr:DUF3971 domain-containing protein [Rickettsiaceae bacterium]
MKILSKLLILISLLAFLTVGLIYAANSGKLDRQMKHALQYYLKLNGIDAKLYHFTFKNGLFKSTEAKFAIGSGTVRIYDLQIQTHLFGSWDNPQLSADIAPSNIVIFDEDNHKFFDANLKVRASQLLGMRQDYDIQLDDIKLLEFNGVNNKPIKNGSAKFICKNINGIDQLDYSVILSEDSFFKVFNITKDTNKLKISAQNIPVLFYKIADKILPEHGLLSFLNESIKDGYIQSASVEIDPAHTLKMDGLVKVKDLEYRYDIEKPSLKRMQVDIELKDANTTFFIKSAYSSEIKLTDGIIKMDWKGLDNTVLMISAKANGPARSLTDFIPESQHKIMDKANINLRKITGNTNVDIQIQVPLKPGSKDIYNISAEIPNASLNIFKNYVKLSKAKMSGVFNGDQVILSGNGRINGFNSDLNFVYNVDEKDKEFGHKLDIKTRFRAKSTTPDRHQKIAFISLLGGNSIVDISYVNKNDKGFIKVDSDISNLDLYFDKLGIRKQKNNKSRIIINSIFDDPTRGALDFAIIGQKGLNIKGDIKIENNAAKIDVQEIKSLGTDLSAKIKMKNGFIDARLHGKTLDLSEADMLQLLEKERDSGNTKLKMDVKRVRLQDNIWLDDLSLKFECDKSRCYSGFIDSKIGSRSIEMLLTANGAEEEWLIKCGNAGAFLKGIGAYDDMKSGQMTLNIKTSRKEVRPGEIIPILNGHFTFERFVLHDAPAMSRLVSVVSLPGLVSLISGNKDIVFSGMNGDFSFKNKMLIIDNSAAEGPFFDFTLKGNIDTSARKMNLKGHVNPALYGVSSVIGVIPIIGRIFTGNDKHRGLMSATYEIDDSY